MNREILAFNYREAKSVVVCGDIHGAFEEMVFKLCVQYGMTDTLLIVAGDCGFGFEKPGYYDQVFLFSALFDVSIGNRPYSAMRG